MNIAQALGDLLAGVEAGVGRTIIGYDAVSAWDATILDTFISLGLLKPASAAQSLECKGCEERCFTDVVVQSSKEGEDRAFVVCEVPHKREEMGRVPVRMERLGQWLCNAELLAQFIAAQLGLSNEFAAGNDSRSIRLGMLKGPEGRRWVTLLTVPLALEVNQQNVPLSELLFADDGEIALDVARIQSLLDMPAGTAGKSYTPSTSGREARKLATQAMYQDWQDAYDSLREEHPDQTKKWYALRLARTPVARRRDSETIRKNIK